MESRNSMNLLVINVIQQLWKEKYAKDVMFVTNVWQ